MNRDQLDQRNSSVIRRHWRTLADSGGKPSPELLADLAAIAEEYALGAVVKDEVRTAYEVPQELSQAWDEISGQQPAGGGGEMAGEPSIAVTPGEPERRTVPARTTPARTRTRNRGAAK